MFDLMSDALKKIIVREVVGNPIMFDPMSDALKKIIVRRKCYVEEIIVVNGHAHAVECGVRSG